MTKALQRYFQPFFGISCDNTDNKLHWLLSLPLGKISDVERGWFHREIAGLSFSLALACIQMETKIDGFAWVTDTAIKLLMPSVSYISNKSSINTWIR